jgi:hypothetical protein
MIERVTLDDLFPRAAVGDEPLRGIEKYGFSGPCVFCGTPSGWIDVEFEHYVCSMVCDDAFWSGYEYARAWHPGIGLKLQDHTVKSDLQATLDLVEALYESGEDRGWNKADCTRLVGQCLLACADELEKDDG